MTHCCRNERAPPGTVDEAVSEYGICEHKEHCHEHEQVPYLQRSERKYFLLDNASSIDGRDVEEDPAREIELVSRICFRQYLDQLAEYETRWTGSRKMLPRMLPHGKRSILRLEEERIRRGRGGINRYIPRPKKNRHYQ